MRNLTILLLLCCFYTQINAQKNYIPVWTTLLRDSSLSPELSIILNPIQILEDKNNDIYTLSNFNFGWALTKTNGKTGKIIWQNRRSFKYPNKDSSQYWPSGMYLDNERNSIEVLGCRLWTTYPGLILQASGNGIKVIYDVQNGKETYYTSPNYLKNGLLITGYGNNFVKNKDTYYVLEGNYLPGLPFYGWLRKSNNDFTKRDTLNIFKIDDEVNKMSFNKTSKPLFIDNYIYYYAQFDSKANHVYRLHKVDTLGNLVFMKNIFDQFYSIPSRVDMEQRLGGLVFTSGADTNNIGGTNLSYYIMKLDKNGAFQWRSFFKSPDVKPDNSFFLLEEIKDKGFFVVGSAFEKKHSNLYWIDKNGKIKYLGNIRLPQYKDEDIFINKAFLNSKNQFVLSFGFTKCLDPNATEVCEDTYAGLALIGDINVAELTTTEEVVLSEFELFPNPTISQLEIRTDKAFDELKIYNITMQVQMNIFAQNSIINVETLLPGLYFIDFYENKKKVSKTKKFLKL